MTGFINRLLKPFNFTLKKVNHAEQAEDIYADAKFMAIYEQVRDFTMSSIERMYSLYQSIHFIIDHNLPGDFVECGVWKGGSSMIIALTLKELGVDNRSIYMYDTYEGMSEPTDDDKDLHGSTAESQLNTAEKTENIWCYSTIDEVKANMQRTGYPSGKIVFCKGKVEDTIPHTIPEKIALLRLDTDWYESTRHELIHLYPLLCKQGVLILDDYGHWQGARKAVDEYFAAGSTLLLNRIDYTGRIAVKI
ncbi:MAG: TylF/MycF/NovP-related O-methyltransferase [Niastella sp.]|uniref:TylF/MycF/NovP-related O-methyltransferase n=1 Tax=Niastella sp. TaxID=1869183 RepID=UPI00389AB0B0